MNIALRRAAPADAGLLASVHTENWRDTYPGIFDPAYLAGQIEDDRRSVWQGRLDSPALNQIVLIAEATSSPAGFACGYVAADPVWGSLVDNLHILPAFRGRGIGEHLLHAMAALLARGAPSSGVHLWVFEANHSARRFYTRLGGEVVERAISTMPPANGATELRIAWRDASLLSGAGAAALRD